MVRLVDSVRIVLAIRTRRSLIVSGNEAGARKRRVTLIPRGARHRVSTNRVCAIVLPRGIDIKHRVTLHIGIGVQPTVEPYRVTFNIPSDSRVVISQVVVVRNSAPGARHPSSLYGGWGLMAHLQRNEHYGHDKGDRQNDIAGDERQAKTCIRSNYNHPLADCNQSILFD